MVGSRYIGGSYSSCSVQIRVVKLSDAGQYHFRFETDQPLGRWTSPNTITLHVTGRFRQKRSCLYGQCLQFEIFCLHTLSSIRLVERKHPQIHIQVYFCYSVTLYIITELN